MLKPGRYKHVGGETVDVLSVASDSTKARPGNRVVVYSVDGETRTRDLLEFVAEVEWPDGVRRSRFIREDGSNPTIDSACPDMVRYAASVQKLTFRERQVAVLLSEGKTTKEVADALGVSPKTVETHRVRIYSKLDVHNPALLTRVVIYTGLAPL